MGELSGKPVKLHLGAGPHHWPGFVNVDKHGEADIQADMRELPFDPVTADEIHAIHCVEHVPRMALERMLQHWHLIMKRGGKLVIEVPCLNKIAQMVVDGEKNLRLTVLGIFGDPRDPKPGMMHGWCYTREELTEALQQSGFDSVTETEPKFHITRRDMRLEAIKP